MGWPAILCSVVASADLIRVSKPAVRVAAVQGIEVYCCCSVLMTSGIRRVSWDFNKPAAAGWYLLIVRPWSPNGQRTYNPGEALTIRNNIGLQTKYLHTRRLH